MVAENCTGAVHPSESRIFYIVIQLSRKKIVLFCY